MLGVFRTRSCSAMQKIVAVRLGACCGSFRNHPPAARSIITQDQPVGRWPGSVFVARGDCVGDALEVCAVNVRLAGGGGCLRRLCCGGAGARLCRAGGLWDWKALTRGLGCVAPPCDDCTDVCSRGVRAGTLWQTLHA